VAAPDIAPDFVRRLERPTQSAAPGCRPPPRERCARSAADSASSGRCPKGRIAGHQLDRRPRRVGCRVRRLRPHDCCRPGPGSCSAIGWPDPPTERISLSPTPHAQLRRRSVALFVCENARSRSASRRPAPTRVAAVPRDCVRNRFHLRPSAPHQEPHRQAECRQLHATREVGTPNRIRTGDLLRGSLKRPSADLPGIGSGRQCLPPAGAGTGGG
jgi:hypothetical protein